MRILKKIVGIFLLFIATILSLSTVFSTLKIILEFSKENGNSLAHNFGYILGVLIGVVALGLLAYFLIKLGIRLIVGKTTKFVNHQGI